MNPLYLIIGGVVALSVVVGIGCYLIIKPIRNIPFLYDKSPSGTSRLGRTCITKPKKEPEKD